MKSLLTVASGLVLCTTALAQVGGWMTSPPGGLLAEGNQFAYYFSYYANGRYQQIDAELRGSAYAIRDVAYRMDYRTHNSATATGRSWTNVALKISETSKYSVMSRTYASNITSTQTTVYNSKHDFPTHAGLPLLKPGVWGGLTGKLRFPFQRAWVYTGQNDILLDFTFLGGQLANGYTLWTGSRGVVYYLDSENVSTISRFGTAVRIPATLPIAPCNDSAITWTQNYYNAFTFGSAFTYGMSNSTVTYRNKLLFHHYSYYTAPSSSVIHALGVAGNAAGVNVGARCNMLYVDLTKPHALIPINTLANGYSGAMGWAVPWQKSLANREVYVQAAWVDSQTKVLGLASATKVTFPDNIPPPRLPFRKVVMGYLPTGALATLGPTTSYVYNPYTAYRIR